jgi:hypothetical protein
MTSFFRNIWEKLVGRPKEVQAEYDKLVDTTPRIASTGYGESGYFTEDDIISIAAASGSVRSRLERNSERVMSIVKKRSRISDPNFVKSGRISRQWKVEGSLLCYRMPASVNPKRLILMAFDPNTTSTFTDSVGVTLEALGKVMPKCLEETERHPN